MVLKRPDDRMKGTMNTLQLTHIPVAKAEMLIRKPVAEVFEAFINPEITTKFWFTKSSGKLEAGKQVTWMWEMYNLSVPVTVKEIEQHKRILIEWGNYDSTTTVEWTLLHTVMTQHMSVLQTPASREMEIKS
jgi:uncharacterized protein YndB with AHSA1/START domain